MASRLFRWLRCYREVVLLYERCWDGYRETVLPAGHCERFGPDEQVILVGRGCLPGVLPGRGKAARFLVRRLRICDVRHPST